MQIDRSARYIIILEMFGFAVLAAAVWLNEGLDLPHRFFGAPQSSIIYEESIFESSIVLMLGTIVAMATRHFMKRITRLEKLLPICSFCKKIRKQGADAMEQGSWVEIEGYVMDKTGSKFSHGLCPACYEKHYGARLGKIGS